MDACHAHHFQVADSVWLVHMRQIEREREGEREREKEKEKEKERERERKRKRESDREKDREKERDLNCQPLQPVDILNRVASRYLRYSVLPGNLPGKSAS